MKQLLLKKRRPKDFRFCSFGGVKTYALDRSTEMLCKPAKAIATARGFQDRVQHGRAGLGHVRFTISRNSGCVRCPREAVLK